MNEEMLSFNITSPWMVALQGTRFDKYSKIKDEVIPCHRDVIVKTF